MERWTGVWTTGVIWHVGVFVSDGMPWEGEITNCRGTWKAKKWAWGWVVFVRGPVLETDTVSGPKSFYLEQHTSRLVQNDRMGNRQKIYAQVDLLRKELFSNARLERYYREYAHKIWLLHILVTSPFSKSGCNSEISCHWLYYSPCPLKVSLLHPFRSLAIDKPLQVRKYIPSSAYAKSNSLTQRTPNRRQLSLLT